MKIPSYLIAAVLMLLLVSTGAVANSQSDSPETVLLGTVVFKPNSVKLDRRSRKELEPILRKLMKLEERRVIQIQGDFAVAKNNEQYLINSLLMSQEVEQYLVSALGSKHEILVAAGKFNPVNTAKSINKVSLIILPSNLRIETITHERLPTQLLESQPLPINEQSEITEEPPATVTAPKPKTPEEIAAEKKAEEQRLADERQLAEDIQKADELVAKERSRAAERDKKRRAADEIFSRLPNPNEN